MARKARTWKGYLIVDTSNAPYCFHENRKDARECKIVDRATHVRVEVREIVPRKKASGKEK